MGNADGEKPQSLPLLSVADTMGSLCPPEAGTDLGMW